MLVGAVLARNEAGPDRYLRRVLDNLQSLCDSIVVVDDTSTDDTADVCRSYGATVSQFGATVGFWGHDETSPRAHLWALAAKAAGPRGWVYIADADHELVGASRADLALLCRAELCNGWAFPLWDCWDSDVTHRVDGFWQAWRTPRVWVVRAAPFAGWQPVWAPRGIHSGHLPSNYPLRVGDAPSGMAIRHLGYVSREHREAKAARYLELTRPPQPVTLQPLAAGVAS